MNKNLGLIFGAVVLLVVLAFWLTGENAADSDDQSTVVEPVVEDHQIVKRELPEPPPDMAQSYELEGDLPLLDDSDDFLASHLRLLLTSKEIEVLKLDQFVRKVVLQIDNIAEGDLIYQHSPIVSSGRLMSIREDTERLVINSESYERYNSTVRLFSALDTGLLVAFYQFYEPLLEDAYSELGYDGARFRQRLILAIDHILAAPVVTEDIVLIQPEVNYLFENEELQSLNMVQKQMIRMGPENTEAIQSALLQFKARIQ